MATTLPARSEINPDYIWNVESLFRSPADWEAEVEAILSSLPELKMFQGRLGESASVLADVLQMQESLVAREQRAYVYASFSYSVDTTNQETIAMAGKARSLNGQVAAAVSFFNPERLEIGEETLLRWTGSEPRLALYEHFFRNLFRLQKHIRSGEVEEAFAQMADYVDRLEALLFENIRSRYPQSRKSY